MSSNLNILKNKKWHVWKYENIAKIEKDEAEHAHTKSVEDKRKRDLDSEDLYARLKRKKHSGDDESDGSNSATVSLISNIDSDQLKTVRNPYSSRKKNPTLVELEKKKKMQKQTDGKKRKKRTVVSRFEKISSSLDSLKEFENQNSKGKKSKSKKKRRKRRRGKSIVYEESEPPLKKRKVESDRNPKRLKYIFPQPLQRNHAINDPSPERSISRKKGIEQLPRKKSNEMTFEELRRERLRRERVEREKKKKFLDSYL